jgi:hypothetical protein
MANWRGNNLKHIQPNIARLTLVADPDGLLTEEGCCPPFGSVAST